MPMQRTSFVADAAVRPRSAARRAVSVLAIGFGILLGSLVFAQSTAENLGLVGPVATVTVSQTYEPESEDPRLRQEWSFAPDGTMTARSFYSYSFMDGSLNYRQVSEFDDTGRLIASENVAPDGTIVGRSVHEYDDEGRRIRNVSYDEEGEENFRFEWIYDGAGNLAARETYRQGELRDRDEFEYDGQGRRISARETDGAGNLTSETTYSVPDLEYEVVEYEDDGTIAERSVVVEGEHGVLSAETYLPDGTLENATYFAYDEDGLTLERRDIYTYESMGNVVTDEATTVYEYEFDEAGNWIRKVDVEDTGAGPTPIGIEVREIAYH